MIKTILVLSIAGILSANYLMLASKERLIIELGKRGRVDSLRFWTYVIIGNILAINTILLLFIALKI